MTRDRDDCGLWRAGPLASSASGELGLSRARPVASSASGELGLWRARPLASSASGKLGLWRARPLASSASVWRAWPGGLALARGLPRAVGLAGHALATASTASATRWRQTVPRTSSVLMVMQPWLRRTLEVMNGAARQGMNGLRHRPARAGRASSWKRRSGPGAAPTRQAASRVARRASRARHAQLQHRPQHPHPSSGERGLAQE